MNLSKEPIEVRLRYFETSFVSEVVDELCQGRVVAWFEGGSELGPRALGHRSIIADPRPSGMRDRINEIKQREWFQPVGGSFLASELDSVFEDAIESPFMLLCAKARQETMDRMPSVVHVDGSCRMNLSKSDFDISTPRKRNA